MVYRIELERGITLTKIEGKSVLFSIKNGETFGLNDSAAEMLEHLMKSDSDTAAAQFAEIYGAPRETIRADMDELVGDLTTMGLARRV